MSETGPQTPFPIDRRAFTIRLRMRLPSDRGTIGAAIGPVLGIARTCGCEDGAEADLEIALHEALANAMVHGNAEHDRKEVRLRCYGIPDRAMVVAIRDEGSGFDPEIVPDPREGDRRMMPHGRGLFLMRELLDHLAYRKGGREVVLYKSFGAPDTVTGRDPAG